MIRAKIGQLPFQKGQEIFIASAKRTPIGSFGGSLSHLTATELGAFATKAVIKAAGIPAEAIRELTFGNVCSAGLGQAPARQVALYSNLNASTVCTTVNKVCSSGMKAIALVAQSLSLGFCNIGIAGGMESMSRVPFILSREPLKYGGAQLNDGLVLDGLTDVYDKIHMGECTERVAERLGITRAQQDAFASLSYDRGRQAYANKAYHEELVPINISKRSLDSNTELAEDEELTKGNLRPMNSLRPVFRKEGSITAGNASKLSDGAAALVLVTSAAADYHKIKPLAEILAFEDAEVEPADFPIAPIAAVKKLLKNTGLTADDIALWEVNEAFAAVCLAFQQEIGVDIAKLNIHGGAIALGHPLGMSGARIVGHLAHCLKKGELGLASICNGGGGASCMLIRKL